MPNVVSVDTVDTVDAVAVAAATVVITDEARRRSFRRSVGGYLIARTPVTRALWRRVVDGARDVDLRPVTDVSWTAAAAFCNRLSALDGLTPCYVGLDDAGDVDAARVHAVAANGWRLPTEAEWEHACRAGSKDVRYGPLDDIAWHRGNSGDVVHPVGEKAPNAWGLADTLGNVWEWCDDVYDPAVYGTYRVFRGGGFADLPHAVRAACRRKSHPRYAAEDVGFRLARTP